MSNTPSRGIPYVPEGTLDPAAGLNISLDYIDALLQTQVISMSDAAPPGSPADGDQYIVAATATGAWAGHEDSLARYVADGAFWQFFLPSDNVNIVLNLDDGEIYKYFGSSGWTQASFSAPQAETIATEIAAGLTERRVCRLLPNSSGSTFTSMPDSVTSASEGTPTGHNPTYASLDLGLPYIQYNTSGSINTSAGLRVQGSPSQMVRSAPSASKFAGFKCRIGFSFNTARSDQRALVGITDSTGTITTTVDPSSLTNIFGIGKDQADTNLQLMHNDGSGTATKVSLGVAFTAFIGKFLQLTLTAPDGGGNISYDLWNVTDNVHYTGTVTTNEPAAATILYARTWVNAGSATATVCTIFTNYVYIDAPF